MNKQRGITLVELLVTVSIVAILARVGIPSFQGALQSSRVSNATNALVGDLRLARSQAIRSGVMVVVCRSGNPEVASPVCNTGGDWTTGWIMFEDRDRNGSFGAGDKLLRIQPAITAVDALTERNNNARFEFTPMGRAKAGTSGYFQVGESIASERQRVVCVGFGGMARVAGDGYTSCS